MVWGVKGQYTMLWPKIIGNATQGLLVPDKHARGSSFEGQSDMREGRNPNAVK